MTYIEIKCWAKNII